MDLDPHHHESIPRRLALGRTLALLSVPSLGAILQGCANKRRAQGDLPEVNWPESPFAGIPEPAPAQPVRPRSPSGWDGQILSRSSWAQAGVVPANMTRAQPYYRITIHHDGMDAFTSTSRSAASGRLEDIRVGHRGRNFGDIGYHYLIDPAGRVWEGRPLSWQGAHVASTNQGNLGICVLGNFERQTPSPESLRTLDRFVVGQMKRFRVPPSRVYTHQELKPTLCPGRNLQRYMLATRRSGAIAQA